MRQSTCLMLCAGAALFSLAGCWRPMGAPYGYGYQSYPGYSGQPTYGSPMYGNPGIQTLTPGGQYVPGTPIPEGSGSPGPTPTYGTDPTGGNASPYYGETRAVPDPIDGAYNPAPNDNYLPPRTGYAPPADGGGFSALRPEPASEPTPAVIQPASFQQSRREAGTGTTVEGTVRFDPTYQTWSIRYDQTPEIADPHAGHFTLAMTPALTGLIDGQTVRLTGQVDPVQRDRHGKATYIATRVEVVR